MEKKTLEYEKLHLPLKSSVLISIIIIVFLFEHLATYLVYDRSAILEGELWRLLTCHLVHFSFWHVSLNIIVFGITGWIIEKKRYPGYGMLIFLMSFVISISLILFEPDMKLYGGLSGIAYGTLTYLTLFGLEYSKKWHSLSRLIFVLVLFKAVVELYLNNTFTNVDMSFRPVPLSHFIGVLVAIMQFYFFKLIIYKHRSLEIK